jgi:hypothetical protein
MNVSDILGFLIMFVVLIISIVGKIYETIDRKRNPKKYEDEVDKGDDAIRQILKEFDITYGDENEQDEVIQRKKKEAAARRKKGQAASSTSITRAKSAPQPLQASRKSVEREHLDIDQLPEQVMEDFEFRSEIEDAGADLSQVETRYLHSKIEERKGENLISNRLKQSTGGQIEIDQASDYSRVRGSPGKRFLKELPNRKVMVVMNEIYGPPKSMQ